MRLIGTHSYLSECVEEAPLRAARLTAASPILGAGAAHVAVLHNGGGLLADDCLSTMVTVEAAAWLHLTSIGATRVHRRATVSQQVARVDACYSVEPGGWLAVLPDAIIPFAGSAARMNTTLTVYGDGRAVLGEIIAAGRVARGEAFAMLSLETATHVYVDGRLRAADRLAIAPGNAAPTTLLDWGDATCLATLWIVAPWLDHQMCQYLHTRLQNDILPASPATIGAVTRAQEGVAMARLLGQRADELKRCMSALARVVRCAEPPAGQGAHTTDVECSARTLQ